MAQGKTSERTVRFSLRLTPEEMATMKRAAAAAGMTMTAFVVAETIGDKVGQMILDGFETPQPKSKRKRSASR